MSFQILFILTQQAPLLLLWWSNVGLLILDSRSGATPVATLVVTPVTTKSYNVKGAHA